MKITLEQLIEIMPNVKNKANLFLTPINLTLERFDISTPLRVAAFLAQVGHESGSFRYMEEIANGSAYDGRSDLGNTLQEAVKAAQTHGTTPGRFYKGHGPIQITGYLNHKKCGEYLGLDLVNSPRLITEPEAGMLSAGWFWAIHAKLNMLADAGDFRTITKRINGGYNGLADREQFYARAKAVLL